MAERPATSTKPLLQKLRYSPGQRAAVLRAPSGYVARFGGDISQRLDGTFDFIQVFATRRDELLRDGPHWRSAMKTGGILWVCYPKGSGKTQTVETDLNRDVVRVALAEVGLEVVSQVAIDDVWSALRAKRQDG